MTLAERSPNAPGPKPVLGDQPIDRLYEAALVCIDRRGFRKTSMDDIARQAGVSRPTVYTYFRSKKDVVLEVIVRQAADLLADVKKRVSRRKGLDRVIEAACLGALATVEHRYFRALVAGGEATEWIAELSVHERFRMVEREFWRPILQEAIDLGEVRADRGVDEMIDWIVFQQFTLGTFGESLGLTERDIRARITVYLGRSLQPLSPAEEVDQREEPGVLRRRATAIP
jgi:AcrR family transcriptional regulator